ncbi:MAG: glycosyl transferase [Bacteroidetes bacterium]|nr:glycosyl transferase [Bacteroidota bacterium]
MTLLSRLVFFPKKKTLISSGRIITNEISLVLPVKDNQKGVNHYLDIFFDIYKPCDFPKEVIIIDNNSKPAIKISENHLQKGLTIKLLLCHKPGPASARNLGAKHSVGKWILFNDSDCLPTKTLFSGYVQADNGSVAYAGNIKSYGKDLLSKYYESQEILLPLKTVNSKNEFVPQYLITANTLVWKEAFLKINGFNENISIAGGEDVDLGLRLSEVGELSYAFESTAIHKFDDGLKGFYKRFVRYGQGNRLVEELWQTKMKPNRFRPNISTPFNEIVAVLQFLFLLKGYLQTDKKIQQTNIMEKSTSNKKQETNKKTKIK